MKKSSLFVRAISSILVLTFITGQASASQISSSSSSDTLAPSSISDPNINPTRSGAVKNDIAEKAEPGAIGDGIPLMELVQGKLPSRVTLQQRELVIITSKLRKAISIAVSLSVANKGKVSTGHRERFGKALANLICLQNRLEERAYLYNADVRTPEDYLLGFHFNDYTGLSLELIDRLYSISPTRLAQYIFHECVPEKGIIIERDDHRDIYNEIQSAIFGQDEVLALKKDLRGFIANLHLSKGPVFLVSFYEQPPTVEMKSAWGMPIDKIRRILGNAASGLENLGRYLGSIVRGSGLSKEKNDEIVKDSEGKPESDVLTSKVIVNNQKIPLNQFVADNPELVLGEAVMTNQAEKGIQIPQYPFYVKCLFLRGDPIIWAGLREFKGDPEKEGKGFLFDIDGNKIKVKKEDVIRGLEGLNRKRIESFIPDYQNTYIKEYGEYNNETEKTRPEKAQEVLKNYLKQVNDFCNTYLNRIEVDTEDDIHIYIAAGTIHAAGTGLSLQLHIPNTLLLDIPNKARLEKDECWITGKDFLIKDDQGKVIGFWVVEPQQVSNKTVTLLYRDLDRPFKQEEFNEIAKPILENTDSLFENKREDKLLSYLSNYHNGSKANFTYELVTLKKGEEVIVEHSSVGPTTIAGVKGTLSYKNPRNQNEHTLTIADAIIMPHAFKGSITLVNKTDNDAKFIKVSLPDVSVGTPPRTQIPQQYDDPLLKSTALGRASASGIAPQEKAHMPAVLMSQISEDLPVRAKIFAANLTQILAEHPDQLFFMGIEIDIGESQKAQMMPIYKAIYQIENLTDSNGKRLFPNLMVRRAKAEDLVSMASDLNKQGKLNFNNAFIGARKVSVDSKIYDSIKGEGRAWISAIDDSKSGDYLPVFEAITLNMMAYLNADITAIKNFYDAISDKPIDPTALQDMLKNRIIYILPKATAFDTTQLRELYELAHQVYIAA